MMERVAPGLSERFTIGRENTPGEFMLISVSVVEAALTKLWEPIRRRWVGKSQILP